MIFERRVEHKLARRELVNPHQPCTNKLSCKEATAILLYY